MSEMVAGRETDALVAEKVMGWRWAVDECEAPSLNDGRCEREPNIFILHFTPSRAISSAWKVVEKLNADGWRWGMVQVDDAWVVNLYNADAEDDCSECGRRNSSPQAEASTLPLAICLAALAAVGTPQETA